jgi:hypothetical protein
LERRPRREWFDIGANEMLMAADFVKLILRNKPNL